MKPLFRATLMVLAALSLPPAFAQAPAAAAEPALVSGLPDFTRLVDRTSPAVVNIEATSGGAREERAGASPNRRPSQDEEMPEFFRRFFGQPGMPQPGPRGGVSQGSGFIMSADGYVLTNHHVVEGADDIVVRLADRREFKAELVGSDPLSDVALLKVEGSGLPTLALGDSRNLKPGQWVVAH